MSSPSNLTSSQLPELTGQYFGMRWGQFWRWAEQSEVVEWPALERTIAYRAELAELLRNLAGQGLPPLAAVLLLLAACADSWPAQGEAEDTVRALPQRMFAGDDDPAPEQLDWHLRHVSQFLDVVRAIPANLRTGPGRLHLLREVFSAQAPQVAAEWAGAVLDEWQSGRQDEWLARRFERYFRRALLRDTSCLVDAYNRFPSPELLAQHLRTGLSQLPALLAALPQLAAPPAPTPPAPPAPPPSTDLLTQLDQDARTAGLARLARHLLAGLRIPARAEGAGERPLGGVADLTNRGPLDRLLLSELAHDELTLTARLVNNEALYLRREEPPLPDVPPTVILLDTTLRLWGTPRVFGLAAALAWAQQAGRHPRAAVQAFALGGQAAAPLDLTTLPGVVTALSYLDPAPHCGPALQTYGRNPGEPSAAGGVLITAAELVQQPSNFAQLLAGNALGLRFLLTVDRAGTLALHEWAGGARRLVGTTHYDLPALLHATPAAAPPPPPPLPRTRGRLPAFLRQPREMLFLPAAGVRPTGHNTIYHPALGVLSITATQRLLYWAARTTGARELVAAFPDGRHFFGADEAGYFYVLTQRGQRLALYTLATATGQLTRRNLTALAQLPAAKLQPTISFHWHCFYVQTTGRAFGYDCRRNCPVAYDPASGLPIGGPPLHWTDLRPVRRFINNGYMVLHRVRRLGLNEVGELVVEGHELRAFNLPTPLNNSLLLTNNHPSLDLPYRVQATPGEWQAHPANPKLWLRRFAWPDGSECLLDSRGLLHLRSADATVPEVTVVLVLGRPTAAWASDGAVCGPDYFTGPSPARRLPAAEFSRQYFQPFIAQLG